MASPDDRLIAVMGVTGVGKSSFVQLFTEEPIGVGHDLESCEWNPANDYPLI